MRGPQNNEQLSTDDDNSPLTSPTRQREGKGDDEEGMGSPGSVAVAD